MYFYSEILLCFGEVRSFDMDEGTEVSQFENLHKKGDSSIFKHVFPFKLLRHPNLQQKKNRHVFRILFMFVSQLHFKFLYEKHFSC